MVKNFKSILLAFMLVTVGVFAFGFSSQASGRFEMTVKPVGEVTPGADAIFTVTVKNNTNNTYEAKELAFVFGNLDDGDDMSSFSWLDSEGVITGPEEPSVVIYDKVLAPKEEVVFTFAGTLPITWNEDSCITVFAFYNYGARMLELALYSDLPYSDVSSADWYINYTTLMYQTKIMTGMTSDTFGGNVKLSRAHFATILWRFENMPEAAYDASKFPDVPDGTFYTKPVMWANNNNIITGYENGKFGAADQITREQIAVMMYRYADFCDLDTTSADVLGSFPDGNKVSGFAVEAMKWAVHQGLISGNGNGTLNPQGTASRAECAAIVSRFLLATLEDFNAYAEGFATEESETEGFAAEAFAAEESVAEAFAAAGF